MSDPRLVPFTVNTAYLQHRLSRRLMWRAVWNTLILAIRETFRR